MLPCIRIERLGDVHAFMGKVNHKTPKARIKTSMTAGLNHLPGAKSFALNKYSLPSYTQINGDLRYIFDNTLKGLEAQHLVVGKLNNS